MRLVIASMLIAQVAAAGTFDALPKGAAELATKATAAVDGSDEDAVVALLPTQDGADLKKVIDDQGGLAKWRGATTAWHVTRNGAAWDVSSSSVAITLVSGDKAWTVASIKPLSGYGVGSGGGGCGGMSGHAGNYPKVKIATPTVKKGNVALVRRMLMRNKSKITYCYEQDLARNASAQGTIAASFTIGKNGAVSDATASGVDADTDACVQGVIADIAFPKSKAKQKVTVSITFAPGGS